MKKLIAAGVTMLMLVLGVALAPAANAWSNRDYQYVRVLRADTPAFKAVPMKTLVKSAKLSCDILRGGASTVIDLVDMAMESGMTQKQAISLVAGAVTFYCPEQGDWI